MHVASPKYKVCTVGGNTVERDYGSEVEVVAGLTGQLSDGQTDRLAVVLTALHVVYVPVTPARRILLFVVAGDVRRPIGNRGPVDGRTDSQTGW